MTLHRALAIAAAIAGILAALTDSRPPAANIGAIASAIAREQDHVTALELAQWIRDRRPGLRILDLRPVEEFESYRVPRSERVAIESLATMSVAPAETLVLISGGGAHAAQGWVLLRTRGVRNVYFLRGGLDEWIAEVMNPAKSNELSDYFGGVPRGDRAPADAAAIRRRGC